MKRFILSAMPNPEGMIRLYEKDYHYLVRVRRLKAGMCFEALLPDGNETQVRILSTVDNILIGECLGASKTFTAAGDIQIPIALFQGLPKGTKMDLIVRQAAEGGVSVVAPFVSEYSAARPNKESAEKLKRWERIVKEARQQSGSALETEIRTLCSFNAVIDYWESLKKEYQRPMGILLHQEALEKGTFHGYLGNCPDFVALAVGPEGGFSPREVTLFRDAGFKPLLMGNTILRTETAALYGCAAIKIILLEKKAWIPRPAE